MKELEKLKEAYGEVICLTTPSGNQVTLRSQNGDDDDVISNANQVTDGSSTLNFIQGIVVDSTFTTSGKLSKEDALNLRLADKYFIILASRIFSIGQILKYEYKWDNDSLPVAYEDDLANFIWDYSNTEIFPYKTTDKDYNPSRIKPISKDVTREFLLYNGKKMRFTYMTTKGERYLLGLPLDVQSKNQELLARELSMFIMDKWVTVENFRGFSPLEMREIRNEVFENDPVLDIYTEITNPKNPKEIVQYPILGSSDFFFPREI